MDFLPPTLIETRPRRKSIGEIPYHHNLDLQQLFDTCRVCIFAVEQSLRSSTERPVLFRRLEDVDDKLKSIATQFSAPPTKVSDNCAYLLILVLQQVYESLRHYIETRCSPVSNVVEFTSEAGIVVLKMIPHGQVHVSIEKLAELLDITDDEADQLEEFVYQLHRRIVRETKYTSPLERIVSATEMWTEQFVALSLYSFPRTKIHLLDSVKSALNTVKDVLEMRDLHPVDSTDAGRTPVASKSSFYFWRELNSGGDGLGKVYQIRAKDSRDGGVYACKVLRQSHDSDISAEREAVLNISRGHHPNIVEVIDTWTEWVSSSTTCYIQMELCEGDLTGYLQNRYDRNPLTSTEIWRTFRQIISGIQYIHSLGMVHRDIKPKNILYVTNPNLTLTWKITDFGFSSTIQHVTLRRPVWVGEMTRNYFSPELLISSRSDSKSDIWSAGCILYKLAVGVPAFPSDEAIREYAWSGSKTPRVSASRADLGNEIEKIIGRMLDISPEQRPDATTVLRYIKEAEGRWALAKCDGYMVTV